METMVGQAAPQLDEAQEVRPCTSPTTESAWSAGGWQLLLPDCLQFQKVRQAPLASHALA